MLCIKFFVLVSRIPHDKKYIFLLVQTDTQCSHYNPFDGLSFVHERFGEVFCFDDDDFQHYARVNYREPRILAKYIPRAVGQKGRIWL